MEPFVYEPMARLPARMIGMSRACWSKAHESETGEVDRFEARRHLRLPFRSAVTTSPRAVHAIVRVASAARRPHQEGVAPKRWLPNGSRRARLSDDSNFDQLRQSLDIAIRPYKARDFDTHLRPVPLTTYLASKRCAAPSSASIRWEFLRARPLAVPSRCAGQGHGTDKR